MIYSAVYLRTNGQNEGDPDPPGEDAKVIGGSRCSSMHSLFEWVFWLLYLESLNMLTSAIRRAARPVSSVVTRTGVLINRLALRLSNVNLPISISSVEIYGSLRSVSPYRRTVSCRLGTDPCGCSISLLT